MYRPHRHRKASISVRKYELFQASGTARADWTRRRLGWTVDRAKWLASRVEFLRYRINREELPGAEKNSGARIREDHPGVRSLASPTGFEPVLSA
jgi:hypothetical protein